MAPGHDSSALDEQRLRELIDVGRSLVAEQDPEAVLPSLAGDRLQPHRRSLRGAQRA